MELISPYEWEDVSVEDTIHLPAEYGCYAFIQPWAGVVYIGRSKMLCTRLRAHSHKILRYLGNATRIAFNTELYDHEKELIQKYKPIFNTAHLELTTT